MQRLASVAAGLALVTGLAGSGTARAAMITNTVPVTGNEPFDTGQDFYVPQFDSTLGTLTGVYVSLIGELTPAVEIVVPSPPASGSIVFSPWLKVFFASPPNWYNYYPSQSVPVTIDSGIVSGSPDTVDFSGSFDASDLVVGPPGYYDFYILGESGATLPLGVFADADVGDIEAELAVTYTYTPNFAVPEPASMALLASGFAGLLTLRRRRAAG